MVRGRPAGLLCEGRVLYGKENHLFTSKHKNNVVFQNSNKVPIRNLMNIIQIMAFFWGFWYPVSSLRELATG